MKYAAVPVADYGKHETISAGQKLVHFIRHAEGHHNVAGEKDWEEYKNDKYEDALLSEKGMIQCRNVASQLTTNTEARILQSEVVITSVMRRCLQTASYSFPMLIDKVSWEASELCREMTGQHPCDRRVTKTESYAMFGHINFEKIVEEEDPLYWKWGGNREPDEDMKQRCLDFLDFMFDKEEREILVCTHSAILSHLIPLMVNGSFSSYRNAEIRSYIIQPVSNE